MATPNPTRAIHSQLNGVSCFSPRTCIAVGSRGPRTLAERWAGGSWSIQSTLNSAQGDVSLLSGVSCVSPSICIAVGNQGGGALVERWSGTSWSLQPTATAVGDNLTGVSCVSLTACTAVSLGGPAERWNGRRWSIQPTANSEPEVSNLLNGVSCASTTACTAVGDYQTIGGHHPHAGRALERHQVIGSRPAPRRDPTGPTVARPRSSSRADPPTPRDGRVRERPGLEVVDERRRVPAESFQCVMSRVASTDARPGARPGRVRGGDADAHRGGAKRICGGVACLVPGLAGCGPRPGRERGLVVGEARLPGRPGPAFECSVPGLLDSEWGDHSGQLAGADEAVPR